MSPISSGASSSCSRDLCAQNIQSANSEETKSSQTRACIPCILFYHLMGNSRESDVRYDQRQLEDPREKCRGHHGLVKPCHNFKKNTPLNFLFVIPKTHLRDPPERSLAQSWWRVCELS